MRRTLLTLLLAFALAAPLIAVEPEQRAAAEHLLEVTKAREQIDQMLELIKQSMEQQLASMNLSAEQQEHAARAQAEMVTWFESVFTWDELSVLLVEIWTDTFTTEELQQLADFWQTPLGEKLIAKQPEIMQRSMAWSQQKVQELMPEIEARMNATIEELGQIEGP